MISPVFLLIYYVLFGSIYKSLRKPAKKRNTDEESDNKKERGATSPVLNTPSSRVGNKESSLLILILASSLLTVLLAALVIWEIIDHRDRILYPQLLFIYLLLFCKPLEMVCGEV